MLILTSKLVRVDSVELQLAYCYVIARPRCPMFVARCVLGSILDRLGCLFIFGEYQGLFSS